MELLWLRMLRGVGEREKRVYPWSSNCFDAVRFILFHATDTWTDFVQMP